MSEKIRSESIYFSNDNGERKITQIDSGEYTHNAYKELVQPFTNPRHKAIYAGKPSVLEGQWLGEYYTGKIGICESMEVIGVFIKKIESKLSKANSNKLWEMHSNILIGDTDTLWAENDFTTLAEVARAYVDDRSRPSPLRDELSKVLFQIEGRIHGNINELKQLIFDILSGIDELNNQ